MKFKCIACSDTGLNSYGGICIPCQKRREEQSIGEVKKAKVSKKGNKKKKRKKKRTAKTKKG